MPGSPVIWLDFSDTSTLWQDTSATTPVTTNGDTIQRIDSKGSDTTNWQNAVSPPSWSSAHVNGLGCGTFDGSEHLTTTVATGPGNTFTFLVIANTAITSGGNDFIFSWDSTDIYTRFGTSSTPPRRAAAGVSGSVVDANSAPAENETMGIIGNDSGSNTQQRYYSTESGSFDTTVTSAGPANSTTSDIGYFLGSNWLNGDICEIVVWNDSPAIADVKAYAERWGFTWA
jgi:hypothetical protein